MCYSFVFWIHLRWHFHCKLYSCSFEYDTIIHCSYKSFLFVFRHVDNVFRVNPFVSLLIGIQWTYYLYFLRNQICYFSHYVFQHIFLAFLSYPRETHYTYISVFFNFIHGSEALHMCLQMCCSSFIINTDQKSSSMILLSVTLNVSSMIQIYHNNLTGAYSKLQKRDIWIGLSIASIITGGFKWEIVTLAWNWKR